MRKTRLLACLLAMLMLISAVPALAEGTAEPVILKAYMNNAGFDQSGWGKDIVSRTIIEKTGVNLEFDITAGDDSQKLNLLIASDDLPDLIFEGYTSAAATAMIQNDRVIALDDLAPMFGSDFMESEFIKGNIQNLKHSVDGKVYGIPSEYTDRNKLDDGVFLMPAPGYYYRKDLNDAIGAPKLETLDDLAANARLAYEADPMGLTHPIFLWNPATAVHVDNSGISILYYSMGGKGPYFEGNGKIESRARDPLYKETLLYINRLVNEGLINPADFTDTSALQEVVNVEPSYYASVGPYWRALVPHDQMPLEYPEVEIDVVPPLKQPGVDKFVAPVTGLNGWMVAFVNKKSENLEACWRFIEYINSDEGQLLVTAGIEGEHWEWGGPEKKWVTLIGEAKEAMASSWNDWVGLLGTYKYQWCARNYYDSALCWGLAIDDPFKMKVYETENAGTDFSAYTGIDPVAGSDEDVIRQKYIDMWKVGVTEICLAGSEEEASAAYDELIASFDQIGLAKVEDIWTANFAAKNAG